MNIFHSPKQRAKAKERASRQAKKAHRETKKRKLEQEKENRILTALEAIQAISYQANHDDFRDLCIPFSNVKRAISKHYKEANVQISVTQFERILTDRKWDNTSDKWTGGEEFYNVILRNKSYDKEDPNSWRRANINTKLGLYRLDDKNFKSLLGLHRAMIKKAL
jgi:hypothetical protein